MRSIVYAALWLIAGFGFTEFMADFLHTWQVRPQQTADSGFDDTAVTRARFEPSPGARPGRPSPIQSSYQSSLAVPPMVSTAPPSAPILAPPAVRWD